MRSVWKSISARPAFLAIVLLMLLPLRASGDTATDDQKAKARELYRKAQVHYRTGELDKAAAEFKESYELFSAPETLFNLAQTERLRKNYEKAVFFYRQYLSTAEPGAANRKMIQDRIVELEKLMQEQKQAESAPPQGPEPPTAKSVVTPQTSQPPASSPKAVAQGPEAPAALPRTPIYKKWWLWTIVGAAAVGIGVGVGVGAAHAGSSSNFVPGVAF